MNLKNKAIIIASETTINLEKYCLNNFVVGIERGALVLIQQKIPIDLAIGDFDKVTVKEFKLIKKYAKEMLVAEAQKDYLDGELAIIELKKRNLHLIEFICEANARYDKNISICELVWKHNIYFFNQSSTIFRLNSGTHVFAYSKYKNVKYISFFSNKPSIITINNFKYNVKNLELMPFENKAISNELIENLNGEITTNQNLIVILSH